MKKQYQKPEVYTEDVTMTFVGACCPGNIPVNFNPQYLDYFVPSCGPPCSWGSNYAQAGG